MQARLAEPQRSRRLPFRLVETLSKRGNTGQHLVSPISNATTVLMSGAFRKKIEHFRKTPFAIEDAHELS